MRHSITAAEPWQKLRWSLLLVLQIAAVVLFAIALARPASLETADLAEHTVFIIDASGSMAAIDGEPDRLAEAVAEAKRLRGELPDGGTASLIAATSHPSILVENSDSGDEFERAIDTIRTMAAAVDYESTFALAESMATPDRPTGFVLIGDGQVDEASQRLAPLGTRFIPVGESDTNRAIRELSVNAGPGGLQARVSIESTGGPDALQTLRIDVDGITVVTEEVLIPRGQVIEETYELPSGTRVAAYLDGEDLLAYDNQRYAGAPVLGTLKARVHGDNTFFVDQLLSSIPQVDTQVGISEQVDFEIYVGVPVPADPQAPFIAIDAPGGVQGRVTPSGRVEDPVPTLVTEHPILEDIDVSRIAIAEAQRLSVTEGDVILGAPGAPLILSGDVEGIPYFYLAFTLEQSNLPIDIAYPIMGARMVGALASAQGAASEITVGERIAVGVSRATVIDPRGNRVVVSVGDSPPLADQSGFWIVEREGEEPTEFAVNPDIAESDLEPVTTLPELRMAPPDETVEAGPATISRSLLHFFLAALLLVLAVELLVSYRARGVLPRQWRWGLGVRALIVTLIVVALVNPVFATRSDEVTTVFVVDVSESMGSSVETARSWVTSAITDAGSGRWAVVEFAEDARVAAPVGTLPYRRARGVSPQSTNLARGLRLGESVLTGETKERIVLVSDGRGNTGDLQAEVDRLKTLGVVVDVHTVAGEQRTDAAVAGIDLPSSVNEGELFAATVGMLSTITAEATVELISQGEVVGSREVSLEPGANYVTFQVEAGAPGLQELTGRVRLLGDSVLENDETTSAVEVRGPARVLVLEGEASNGVLLENVLEARGLVVERQSVEEMPGVQELSAYRAIILVDVSSRDLSTEKMATLDGFVRNLGRGLLVVGGTHAYGLGGYRDTPLEALLPVDSEPADVEREAEVAEVLLIDTSESMGACHCSETGMGDEQGGPNKTDISKAAAVRAIEALGSGDEVGLLAFSGTSEWLIPLQEFPDRETIDRGVGSLRPFGETRIIPALRKAADALRESDKELKHIILFTDGFTGELNLGPEFVAGQSFGGNLVGEVEALADEGITVSVVGTGEGAIPALEDVAEAGKGRFYPGRDLDEIPEIFVKEARLASRSFINEGRFFPAVTSTAPAVRDLASSPALLGYIATSPKPTAQVHLQVGEFSDPLLATWRVGLGEVAAWTSDSGDKWASSWASWDGFGDFWSDVVRDIFPLEGSEGQSVRASIADELMTVTLEGAEPWPAGTEPVGRVSFPDGTSEQFELERASDHEFSAVLPARQGGAYAVGVSVLRDDGETVVMSTVASRSFAAEFLPGDPDPDLMAGISANTGGRGEIAASQAFAAEGLESGVTERTFRGLFLLLAALLWPVDVALRRLRLSRREPEDLNPPPAASRARPTTPADARTR
jgi:Mg-chelatase subunit ChlD